MILKNFIPSFKMFNQYLHVIKNKFNKTVVRFPRFIINHHHITNFLQIISDHCKYKSLLLVYSKL